MWLRRENCKSDVIHEISAADVFVDAHVCSCRQSRRPLIRNAIQKLLVSCRGAPTALFIRSYSSALVLPVVKQPPSESLKTRYGLWQIQRQSEGNNPPTTTYTRRATVVDAPPAGVWGAAENDRTTLHASSRRSTNWYLFCLDFPLLSFERLSISLP